MESDPPKHERLAEFVRRFDEARPNMNQIQKLEHWLKTYLPDCEIHLDCPMKPEGKWFLDVGSDGQLVNVVWQRRKKLGISANSQTGFGEGPDEVYPDFDSALRRVLVLLMMRRHTTPPPAVQLAELRRERKLTQEELAVALKLKQASVSKAEKRGDDIHLRTLKKMVQALGGRLSIRAVFPDGMERELQIDDV